MGRWSSTSYPAPLCDSLKNSGRKATYYNIVYTYSGYESKLTRFAGRAAPSCSMTRLRCSHLPQMPRSQQLRIMNLWACLSHKLETLTRAGMFNCLDGVPSPTALNGLGFSVSKRSPPQHCVGRVLFHKTRGPRGEVYRARLL